MIESSKSIFGCILEVTIDYFICSAIAVKIFFTTISRAILIICLLGSVVLIIGTLFYALFIILGYFILLAMISPETAEKILKGEVIPRVKDRI